jgi:hypothetical protein
MFLLKKNPLKSILLPVLKTYFKAKFACYKSMFIGFKAIKMEKMLIRTAHQHQDDYIFCYLQYNYPLNDQVVICQIISPSLVINFSI